MPRGEIRPVIEQAPRYAPEIEPVLEMVSCTARLLARRAFVHTL